MSLARFIFLLTSLAIAFFCLSGFLFYGISVKAMQAQGELATRLSAESSAKNISHTIARLNHELDSMAKDPRLADVLGQVETAVEEQRLKDRLFGALQVRLLNGNVDMPDETRSPHMGFADLVMARQAHDVTPMPMVHAANTADVHLAMARKIENTSGVLLVSFSLKGLEIPAGPGALALRQGSLVLNHQGDKAGEAPLGEVNVPGTAWNIAYWMPSGVESKDFWYFIATLSIALAFAVCAYFAYRWLVKAFMDDCESVVLLVKALIHGKIQGSYPVKIMDAQNLIGQISQMKRLMSEEHDLKTSVYDPLAQNIFLSSHQSRNQEPFKVEDQTVTLSPEIFRAYDIRGIVGKTLNAEVVYSIGKAIGSEALIAGEQSLMIARDGRLSSPELSKALAMGVLSTGCHVIDLGLAPTPLLYFSTHVLKSRSGVMLTGSHNPGNYNGLKIVIKGETLSEEGIQALRKRIEANDFSQGSGQIENKDLSQDYMDVIAQDIHPARPLKVVMDCGNGVAATLAPQLLKRLGCDLTELYCEVDGHFPHHHPDPSKPENLKALIDTVLAKKADLGVAFDGDADRLGLVDSEGKIIWPDRQMMVFAKDVLARNPGADIIYDVKCTRHLADFIVKFGGKPSMWKTGHSLIKAKIKETGALLAGEMSGHVFFKERWYGFDDGIYACARMIEILSNTRLSSAEVFSKLPDSVNTPELNVGLQEGENFSFMEKLCAVADFPDGKITEIDGLRVDFKDGFGLVRASNTTPSLVIRFEADDEMALWRIQKQFKDLILQVKPGLSLPF